MSSGICCKACECRVAYHDVAAEAKVNTFCRISSPECEVVFVAIPLYTDIHGLVPPRVQPYQIPIVVQDHRPRSWYVFTSWAKEDVAILLVSASLVVIQQIGPRRFGTKRLICPAGKGTVNAPIVPVRVLNVRIRPSF